jgi:predicted nucleic acid-binding protein
MAGDLYLVDSNILIRWVQPGVPDFELVRRAIQYLEDSRDVPCYTSQNLGEFWNVLTRPADRNGYGLKLESVLARAEQVEAKFRLLPDSLKVHIEWRRLLVRYSVSGTQVHDARLVAAMHVHGVRRILTFNTKDFTRFADIEVVHPADLARAGARE